MAVSGHVPIDLGLGVHGHGTCLHCLHFKALVAGQWLLLPEEVRTEESLDLDQPLESGGRGHHG